jgi:1-pyrroline-5-carboxylate dehydrogenase
MDAVTHPPAPVNETVHTYAPGSAERARIVAELDALCADRAELTMTINGVQRMAGGDRLAVVAPHRHSLVLGQTAQATNADVEAAIGSALAAAPAWQELPFDERAAVFLRAAELLSGPWRDRLNAATMLGQSKTVHQAEIDSACELADFLRFNVHFAREILEQQPASSAGVWNRSDYRPLEGFVLAITPFNFTAIAGNLPSAPALLGNVVVWKPSPTQQLAAHHTMRLFEAAGLPAGVINLITGDGAAVSQVALPHPALAGIHFTGSTPTFQHLWQTVGANIGSYASYPRLVGETGGKDFVVAHPSADPAAVVTGLVRGAFEYQGQKCSAASRAYLPRSLWDAGIRDELAAVTESLAYGDVADLGNFGGAVIDRRAFDRLSTALDRARSTGATILAGGSSDDSVGWFVRPSVIVSDDPTDEVFRREYFGPILAVHVYDDASWADTLTQLESVSPYALTGAVFARDRAAVLQASQTLRFAAGNFYVNDKPTGAVVGQQPFGGARSSGTNDKAGSPLNLLRWLSPRSIKETFVPATDHRYPHMG